METRIRETGTRTGRSSGSQYLFYLARKLHPHPALWSLFSSLARLEEIESFWRQLIWRDSCKDAGRPGRRSLRFRAAALLDSATRRGQAALVLNPSRVKAIGVTPPFVKNCTLSPEISSW